ncbi:TPA: hypothetical protein QFT68_004821 [Raoultella ornithinolytica]|nr:hypothetical protein [Raoultella ornithinolytica]
MTSKLTKLTDDELTETLRLATSGYPLPACVEGNLRQAFAELQERRKADSEPVAWLAIYHGEVYDEAIGITRSVVEAQADHFGWELALTEIIPLYRHAQPAPVVPDGWVMVPKEPTERMVIDGFESEPDETFSEPEVWEACQKMSGCKQAAYRARLCYAAMISAAPKQEDI